jgi:hypothetical protein
MVGVCFQNSQIQSQELHWNHQAPGAYFPEGLMDYVRQIFIEESGLDFMFRDRCGTVYRKQWNQVSYLKSETLIS